ncbi:MAG: DUF3303 domain-containing protein [Bryobacteraceae bacterium]
MKVMIVWKTIPGKYKEAVDQFLRTGGGSIAPGAVHVGRWHVPGSVMGWHLVEGDLVAISQHVADWSDLLEIEVYPVIEDGDAATAAKNFLGSR